MGYVVRRLGSFGVDLLCGYAAMLGIVAIGLGVPLSAIFVQGGIYGLFLYFGFLAYFTLFPLFSNGYTYGGKVFRVRVVSRSGSPLGVWAALMRGVCLAVIAYPFLVGRLTLILAGTMLLHSFLTVVLAKDKRQAYAFWDWGARTKVVVLEQV